MNFKHPLAAIAAAVILSSSYAVKAQTETPRTSSAQTPAGSGSPERSTLTAEQRAQLKSIRRSERDQLMALRNDQTLSPEQKEAKVRSIREATHQRLLGILTPEQQQGLKNLRRERGAGRDRADRQERFGKGAGEGADAGAGQLNLTDAQRTQLKSIHESTRDQVNAIRNDSTLTQDQKMMKLRSIHQNTRQQVSTILTPEQREKMRGRAGRRNGPGRLGKHGRRGQIGPGVDNSPAVATPKPQ